MTQQINNRLIAFTGPDGIGKTTQCKLLVDWMNAKGDVGDCYCTASYIKELNDSNYIFKYFRELIYSLYNNVFIVTLANLIKLNRYLVWEDIKESRRFNLEYNAGNYFSEEHFDIVDRWNICSYVYLKANNIEESIAASYLTDEHTIIPGLTIMLVGMNGALRTSNRASNNNMFEDVGDDFNVKLAKTYIEFDTSLYKGKVVKINNDELTKEETHELIKQAVLDYFRGNL
jgi:thymidylate kinase